MPERWPDPSPWGAPATLPRPGPSAATAPPRRVKVVETFIGPRLRARTSPGRRFLAAIGLLVLTLVLAALLGAALGAIVWGISVAIHHTASG